MTNVLGAGAAVLAFDIGGTDIKSAFVDAAGEVRGLGRTPTPRSDTDPAGAIVARVRELTDALLAAHPDAAVSGIAVAVPGLVDEEAGIGVFSSNLGWRDAPFAELLRAALPLPVAVAHDVRSASRAELELGAARGYRNAVILAIGTGIAGTTIIDGRVVTGGGYAGEYGHTLADPAGEPCPCGAIGCLETVASAGAIARRYTARSGTPVRGAREVLDFATSGDPIALAVWNGAVDALAQQIARLAAVLAPDVVVLGGGLAEAGDALFVPLLQRVDALLSFHRRPKLVRAELGEDAGLLGVALVARDLADGKR